MAFRLVRSIALASVALTACSPRVNRPDGGDVSDAPIVTDIGTDAPDDAATDAPSDAVLDAATDASRDDARVDAPTDAPTDAPPGPIFCDLPVPAGGGAPIDTVVPSGFCLRRFARIGTPRVLAFAPNGDLFVAAPSDMTPGGASGGPGAIVVLSDDDGDGVAEQATYADGLPDVHGLAFGGGFLFYTTGSDVWRVAYTAGDRALRGRPVSVGRFTPGVSARWTHGLAYSPDGALYATQGNHGSNMCPPTEHDGSISRVRDPLAAVPAPPPIALDTQAFGFRNPMYIRCHPTDTVCLAAELSDDSDVYGAPEKIVIVRPGSMYGYPCCTTTGMNSYHNPTGGLFNCSGVAAAAAMVPLHDTPFGLDWAPESWPAPYANALFIALHGSAYHEGNRGAGVQYAATSPMTRVPGDTFVDFISFIGRGSSLRRPTDLAFARDGRLFLSDDAGGQVFWIAPTTLRRPR